VNLPGTDTNKRDVCKVKTGNRKPTVGVALLAKCWGISLSPARRIIEATTQQAIRSVIHPTLSCRFRTNDRQLRHRRLSHTMLTDTLEADVVSWHRRNRYAQVFCTGFGWVRISSIKTKSEAHEGLSLLAQRDGVPPTCVMDGSKEQTMGDFRRKAR
jgi:hypothetical protein